MIEFVYEGETLVCRFSGHMDTDNCQSISAELMKNIGDSKRPVVFDLAKVDYVSSLFLGLCMSVLRQAGEGKFSITNIHPSVKKVFKIAKLDTLIKLD